MSDEANRENTESSENPATEIEIEPEQVAMLSLRYVDGVPTLVVSGGTLAPAAITAVDSSGTPVAMYTGGPVPTTRQSGALLIKQTIPV
ncbi:hypothetical protein F5X71_18075 [Nocardia brasiliensis]|uniref:Uncharacterized protein n=1 Tax=Nocardia brasiliensis TaxID=37326 RepID=A0A6G9XSV0_NOCBR|nr:hypothetical protein [Nocardia brasiliensis]QIS03976.1 hypothetical protein F5X71_18075 [Nocardia brasiliensis]